MSPTGDSSLRVGVFTRINVVLGVLLYSLFPMFAFWTTIRARQMDMSDVSLLLVGIVSLQAMLFVAARRCSSEQLPFWRGVTITAASMRTGWIYLDMLLAGG